MTTIQGFTPPPNHATMGVESTILDNLTPAPSDMSGQGEPDMSAKLKQRAVINGKVFWLTGSTQQELFQSYLSHAITEGVVVPPDENGQHRKDGLSTHFSDIAERWFTLYKVGKVRETTLTGYESYLKRHVLPYFGEMNVRDISIDDVQLFLNSKESLSKKTIDEIWLVVRMVLDVAFEDGLIPSNPSKSKRLRNPSKKKSTRLPLTTKEAEDIEAHLPDIPKLLDRRYVVLLLYCPARSEDIRGIRMKDIDPHKMLIRIERSVTYAKAKTIIGDPKTEAGFRHMLMLPKLWDVLALTPEEMHDPDAYLLHMRDDTHQPAHLSGKSPPVGARLRSNQRLRQNAALLPAYLRHTRLSRRRIGKNAAKHGRLGRFENHAECVHPHAGRRLGKCPQAADPSLTVCGTACDCAKPPKTQSVQGLNDCYFIEDVTKKVPKSQNFGTLT